MRSTAERFKRKVTIAKGTDDCSLWIGGKHKDGYGHFKIDGKMVLAHRFAWFLETGKWPERQILHTCDNPPCVRFEHLFEGSQPDNIANMLSKGRAQLRGTAKLTDREAQAVRFLWAIEGLNYKELAALFNTNVTTIGFILRRKSYTHLPVLDCEIEAAAEKAARAGLCKNGHEISGSNLQFNAKGVRICRICTRAYARVWMQKKYGRKPRVA